MLNIACLCATYGRPHLVANQIATFLGQSYGAHNRRLLILDDGNQLRGEGEGWKVVSVKERFTSMPEKYTAMLALLDDWWPEWDAVAIMDDDDIYGPDWLKTHAEVLQTTAWSHPSTVFSLYGIDIKSKQPPVVEPTENRFWAAAAITKAALLSANAFFSNPNKTFDVDYLHNWRQSYGSPGDPSKNTKSQYCYGYGRSNHDSATQISNTVWQPTIGKLDNIQTVHLRPNMDEDTKYLWDTLWKRAPEKLTIGMAVYEDFDGVYFTLQALRYYHQDVDPRLIQYLVIDNCPDGVHAPHIKQFIEQYIPNGRYVPNSTLKGTAVRDFIFEEADTDLVMCLDSHVLVEPGGVRALMDYYAANPDSDDLIQGPLILDDIYHMYTHFIPEWRDGMFGTWGTDTRAQDKNAEPFDIPAQGLGLFSCRKRAWLGFNRKFSGFGGEEFYIHEKFRQAGRRALCLPALRWVHRFVRPTGVPYRNVWEDRIRNYILGWREVGRPIDDIVEHFTKLLGAEVVEKVLQAVDAEDTDKKE